MSTQFKDDEICIDGNCRYLPKNGPIQFLPNLRVGQKDLILNCIICVLITILVFILGPMVITMNSGRISAIRGSATGPVRAADMLDATSSTVNLINL